MLGLDITMKISWGFV